MIDSLLKLCDYACMCIYVCAYTVCTVTKCSRRNVIFVCKRWYGRNISLKTLKCKEFVRVAINVYRKETVRSKIIHFATLLKYEQDFEV